MRKSVFVALLLGFCLPPFTVFAQTPRPAKPSDLYRVEKIYVGGIEANDSATAEAERFRILLEEQLSRKGFAVVPKLEEADVVLSGVISLAEVGILGGAPPVYTTLQLKSLSDDLLWRANLGPKYRLYFSSRDKDDIEFRAEDVAKRLREDRKKSAKGAGIKVT